MNSFYDIMRMIKENKIRKGNLLVIKSKTDESFEDYYIVGEKDFKSLIGERECLFDNFYFFDLINNYSFDIIFKEKEKQEVIKKFEERV